MDRQDAALKAIRKLIATKHKRNAAVDRKELVRGAAPFFPDDLLDHCEIMELCKEKILFGRRNVEEPFFYRLLQGDVSVQQEILGEVVTYQRAVPGDWLLKPNAGNGKGRTFAITECQSVLLRIPSKAFATALAHHPSLSIAWCQELEAQMLRLQRRVERINLRQVTRKIIHYLVTESPGNCGEVQLPYRKGVWAAQMGMAPETLSRALKDLIEAGWLEVLGRNRLRLLRAT
jgi:CRP-like cAMP-binding protein